MDLNPVLILCSRNVIRCAPATSATLHSNCFKQLTGHIYHLSRMLYNVVEGYMQQTQPLRLHLLHVADTAVTAASAACHREARAKHVNIVRTSRWHAADLDRSLGINILYNESKIS